VNFKFRETRFCTSSVFIWSDQVYRRAVFWYSTSLTDEIHHCWKRARQPSFTAQPSLLPHPSPHELDPPSTKAGRYSYYSSNSVQFSIRFWGV